MTRLLFNWEIGVDEAGRGPLAGPVAVGLVCVPARFDWALIPGVADSKKLSETRREAIYEVVKKLETAEVVKSIVVMASASHIDKKGIAVVVRELIADGLCQMAVSTDHSWVKLDGGLTAPAEWVQQETIIKGDVTDKVIGLASIMAKVTRDRYMKRQATLAAYAPYDFAVHKGYGTKRHREAIAIYGLSKEHRVSYCKNIKML